MPRTKKVKEPVKIPEGAQGPGNIKSDPALEADKSPKAEVKEPKKSKAKIYKTLYKGEYKIKYITQNAKGEIVNKYLKFMNNEIRTEDKLVIAELENIRENEKDKELKLKSVLTEDEFLAVTSPERLYVPYNGMNIHIDSVRAGLEIAEKHGWKPEIETKVYLGASKSTISRGGMTAGNVKLGI